jgi:DNA-binding transcriptional ArsR family regulator
MQPNQLDAAFSALANPVRRTILANLMNGAMRVSDLNQPLTISAPALSRHLKILEETGLIRHTKQTQYRIYALNLAGFAEAFAYIEHYRTFWNQQFDALDQQLKARTLSDGS